MIASIQNLQIHPSWEASLFRYLHNPKFRKKKKLRLNMDLPRKPAFHLTCSFHFNLRLHIWTAKQPWAFKVIPCYTCKRIIFLGRTYSIYCISICFQNPRSLDINKYRGSSANSTKRRLGVCSSWAAGQQKMVVSSWVGKVTFWNGESWAHCSTILSYS